MRAWIKSVCGAFAFAGLLLSSAAAAERFGFDNDPVGRAPAGWLCGLTGKGNAEWVVVAEAGAPSAPNALKQSGQATFPVAIKQDTDLRDGFVEVKFKPVAGKEDQAGGVIWRVRDADNYYVARANALEDNVTIYRTVQGKRVSFKNASVKVASSVWHTLRVEFAGNTFAVYFDGTKAIEASDDTFVAAGKVGLWTKADSVTLFDDFSYGAK